MRRRTGVPGRIPIAEGDQFLVTLLHVLSHARPSFSVICAMPVLSISARRGSSEDDDDAIVVRRRSSEKIMPGQAGRIGSWRRAGERPDAIPLWRTPSRTKDAPGSSLSVASNHPCSGRYHRVLHCPIGGPGAHVVAGESSAALVSLIKMSRGTVTRTISTPKPHKLLSISSEERARG